MDWQSEKEMTMKRLIPPVVMFLLLAVSVFSAAQQPVDSDVPDRTEVLKFLDLTHVRSQMVQTLDGLAKQMRLGAEESFKEKVPDATPEQLAKVNHLFDGIFKTLPVDEMVDAIVPIYQKHLTKADLAAITAFYSSPAGEKIINELPAIMSESMQVGGSIGRRAFAAKSQEFDQQLAALVKETKSQ